MIQDNYCLSMDKIFLLHRLSQQEKEKQRSGGQQRTGSDVSSEMA